MKTEKIFKFFKKNNKIIFVSIAVLALLLLIGDAFFQTKEKKQTDASDEEKYIDEIQNTLQDALNKIEGVGKCKIVVFASGGFESFYACDSEGDKTKYTVVGGNPLLIRKNNPEISGVLIVCSGGGQDRIKSEVTSVVSTLLNINKSKISVSKLK